MRKLDPLDSDDHPKAKQRSSAAAMMTTTSYKSPDIMDIGNEPDAQTFLIPSPILSSHARFYRKFYVRKMRILAYSQLLCSYRKGRTEAF